MAVISVWFMAISLRVMRTKWSEYNDSTRFPLRPSIYRQPSPSSFQKDAMRLTPLNAQRYTAWPAGAQIIENAHPPIKTASAIRPRP
jgi:hypothetical protein